MSVANVGDQIHLPASFEGDARPPIRLAERRHSVSMSSSAGHSIQLGDIDDDDCDFTRLVGCQTFAQPFFEIVGIVRPTP